MGQTRKKSWLKLRKKIFARSASITRCKFYRIISCLFYISLIFVKYISFNDPSGEKFLYCISEWAEIREIKIFQKIYILALVENCKSLQPAVKYFYLQYSCSYSTQGCCCIVMGFVEVAARIASDLLQFINLYTPSIHILD